MQANEYLQALNEQVQNLIAECKSSLNEQCTMNDINNARVKFLGKSSEIVALQKTLRDVAPELKPEVGKILNQTKQQLTDVIDAKAEIANRAYKSSRLESERIDVTIPVKNEYIGSQHPINIVKKQIIDIFMGLGFDIAQGFEIETDYHNFQALNIPADHPARDMQDTFYVDKGVVLRTHTSPAQVRTMLSTKPPIRILCPGRVYRADDDATHSPVFHQIEGLVVDKKVTLCDLKGTLGLFAQKMFSGETKVRLRPSYFPFTEPSVEADVSCMICGGKGCSLCKGTGWIEILGAGMVNKNVFRNCGIDPDEYSGFAFGMGIERITMLKYGIPDIRLFYENDLRLLQRIR